MGNCFNASIPLTEFALWGKTKRVPFSFELDITARCNNDCRHCYINLPAGDRVARNKELSFQEIKEITDEAVSMGALWCLITGGEPLLREDFFSIYSYMKKKGLLISVFTNATLIMEEHVRLFQKYPPRDIEVTVYGVTQETYERVTRRAGSYAAFMRGLALLIESGVKVRLKAMAIRSNLEEIAEISRFCRERTRDYFRLDPLLHLRYDKDLERNEEIKSERLSPEEITALEASDPERFQALQKAARDSSSRTYHLPAIIFSIAGQAMTISTSVMTVFSAFASLSGTRIVSTISRKEILRRLGKILSRWCGR